MPPNAGFAVRMGVAPIIVIHQLRDLVTHFIVNFNRRQAVETTLSFCKRASTCQRTYLQKNRPKAKNNSRPDMLYNRDAVRHVSTTVNHQHKRQKSVVRL